LLFLFQLSSAYFLYGPFNGHQNVIFIEITTATALERPEAGMQVSDGALWRWENEDGQLEWK